MHIVCALLAMLAMLAVPFWETKAPRDWSEDQLLRMLHDSPWAQGADPAPAVQVYLATAHPLQEAEIELARRRGEARNEEYVEYLRQAGGENLVLAVAYPNWTALEDGEESRRMQEESIMKVGRKKYKMVGHFPPAPSDPYLRLVYPRVVTESDKSVTFELYLPGQGPYHEAEFRVRDMRWRGKLEM